MTGTDLSSAHGTYRETAERFVCGSCGQNVDGKREWQDVQTRGQNVDGKREWQDVQTRTRHDTDGDSCVSEWRQVEAVCGTPFLYDMEWRGSDRAQVAVREDTKIRWPSGRHDVHSQAQTAVERFASRVRRLDGRTQRRLARVWLNEHPGDWVTEAETYASPLFGVPSSPTPRAILAAIREAEGRLDDLARQCDRHKDEALETAASSYKEVVEASHRVRQDGRLWRYWTAEYRSAKDAARRAELRHEPVGQHAVRASAEASAAKTRLNQRKSQLHRVVAAAANAASYAAVGIYCLDADDEIFESRGDPFAAGRAVGQAAAGIVLADLIRERTVLELATPFLVGSNTTPKAFVADYVAQTPPARSGIELNLG